MEDVPAKVPTSEVPVAFTSPKVINNPVQKPTRKRLFILLGIFLLLLILSLSTYIYYEAQDRSYLKTRFKSNQYRAALASPYIPYQIVSPSPTMFSSPVLVSPGRQFLAESDRHRVFIDVRNGTENQVGKLVVTDKLTGEEMLIEDDFEIFGEVSIFQSPDMKYLILDTGTYIFRGADIISLEKKKKVTSFCNWGGTIYFWNNYAVYTGCDTDPRNDNEMETNVEAVSLLTQEKKLLFTANETGSINTYKITSLNGSMLEVEETYVRAQEDWLSGDDNKLFSRPHTLDLNTYLK